MQRILVPYLSHSSVSSSLVMPPKQQLSIEVMTLVEAEGKLFIDTSSVSKLSIVKLGSTWKLSQFEFC